MADSFGILTNLFCSIQFVDKTKSSLVFFPTMKAVIIFFALGWKFIAVEGASIRSATSETAPCIDQPNDVLLPVFGECSQFYGCKNGKAILRNCIEGLFFDSVTKNCTEPSQSDCIQEQMITISSEVTSPEIPEVPRYVCLGKAIGSLVPSRRNCSEYYSCISSRPNIETCGMGYHFHSFTQRCIPSVLSDCVVKPKVQLTTTPKPKMIEVICKGKFDGEKFPVPGNCTMFFDCLGHKAFEKTCGDKHFYPVSRTCIDPDVSECFEGIVRVKPTTTETINTDKAITEGNALVSRMKE